jgi:hypothetical protein
MNINCIALDIIYHFLQANIYSAHTANNIASLAMAH